MKWETNHIGLATLAPVERYINAMCFFRTEDRRRDRSIDEAARLQRRQQHQMQQQVLERLQAISPPLQPLA